MNIAVLELILITGAVLAFGFWQLWDVNRELRKDRETSKRAETDRETDNCDTEDSNTDDRDTQ